MANQSATYKVTGSCLHFLITQLGDTRSENPSGFYEFWVEDLAEFSADELQRGTKEFLRNWKRSTWPSLGEVRAAIVQARRDINAEKIRPIQPDKSHQRGRLPDEQIDLMVRGPLGKRAVNEGWIVGLWDFCGNRHRLPKEAEIGQLKESSEYVRDCAAGLVDMGALHDPLKKLAVSMMNRRTKLSQIYGN